MPIDPVTGEYRPTLRKGTRDALDENPKVFGEFVARMLGAWEEGEQSNAVPKGWEVCRTMGLSYGALLDWVLDTQDRKDKYARMLEVQGELYSHQMVEIADHGTDVKRDRLRNNVRRWLAEHWNQRYQQKVEHNVSGGVTVQIMRFATGQLEEKVVEALPLEQAALPASATPSQAGEL